MLDGYDPIEEIEKLIRTKKSAWFGKYGQPIGPHFKNALAAGERDVYILLVRKGSGDEGGKYVFKMYRALDIERDVTPPVGAFPRYYMAVMSRIRTWIHLAPYEGVAFSLDDLTTKSSGLPLRRSLAHSMKGHFNAVLRVRQNV